MLKAGKGVTCQASEKALREARHVEAIGGDGSFNFAAAISFHLVLLTGPKAKRNSSQNSCPKDRL